MSYNLRIFTTPLFHKHKVNRQHQADASSQVIPLEGDTFEEKHGENNKDRQRDHFLNHFQLHQGKRSPVSDEPQAICGNLGTVLEKGDTP